MGDFGRMDEDGYFFLIDCLKCMINVLGFKVWLVEVESLLYKYFDVQEVCIIGMCDVYCGELVKVVVVFKVYVKGKIIEDDIINWVCDNMVVYKYLCVVEFVDVLFKFGMGKVMWCMLQEQENVRNEVVEKLVVV